jgi:hypothetical protein
MEGFESFGTTLDASIGTTTINMKYVDSKSFYVRAGRTSGGYAFGTSSSTTTWAYLVPPVFSAASTTYIAGFGCYVAASSSTTFDLFTFKKGAYAGVTLRYATNGSEITVYNQGTSTTLGTTSGAGLSVGNWYYVEVKVVDASSGSVEVRVNGTAVCTVTGVDTRSADGAGYDCGVLGARRIYIDDWYIANGSGSACNDFLGDVQIRAIWPAADGDATDWSPSSGSDHYALVDDNPCTADTDYNAAASTASDLFGYGDASDLGDILAVQVNSCMKELSATVTPTMKNLTKISSTVYEASTPAITSAYSTLYSILEVSPATSNAWGLSELNGAQFGVKRV